MKQLIQKERRRIQMFQSKVL